MVAFSHIKPKQILHQCHVLHVYSVEKKAEIGDRVLMFDIVVSCYSLMCCLNRTRNALIALVSMIVDDLNVVCDSLRIRYIPP